MTENLPSNPPQPHAPTGRRGEAGPPNLSAHTTVADQPTTEPSAEQERAARQRFEAVLAETGHGGCCSWDNATPEVRARYLVPAPQPAADLGDLATWTPAEVAASPVGASRLIQRLAAMTHPAADTKTEVQWGVRYRGGHVVEVSSEERAIGTVEGHRAEGFPGLVVVKQHVTRTPWEEA